MHVDIVLPAYNEERRIGGTLAAYRRRLTDPRVRFLVALDSSTDRTAEVVRAHAHVDGRVKLVGFPKLGKGGVLMEAFRLCDAPLIGFVDADRATPPGEFARLLEAAERADGAIATRRHPASVLPARRSVGRRIASAGFAFGVRRLFGLPFTDTQCGAKVLRREMVEAVLPYLSSRDFLFDVDLLYVARSLGFDIVEVPTVWIDREGSQLDALADARRMAASAVRLWVHHRVIPVPALLATTASRAAS